MPDLSYTCSDDFQRFMAECMAECYTPARPLDVTVLVDGSTKLQIPGRTFSVVLGAGYEDQETDDVYITVDHLYRKHYVVNSISGYIYTSGGELAPEEDQRRWILCIGRW